MSDPVSRESILEALASVVDPKTGVDIISSNSVSGLVIKGGNIGFSIEVDPARGAELEPVRKQAELLIRSLPGVLSATVVLTAHNESPGSAPKGNGHTSELTPNRPHIGGKVPTKGPEVKAGSAGLSPRARQEGEPGQNQNVQKIEGVEHIIAVASGKGGVGKSTTSVNLALGLAAQGLKVGLLDADIYGPSVPRLLSLKGKPTSPDGHSLAPMEGFGLKAMSIGSLIDEDTPMIWRGPMVMSALTQLLTDVNWAPLDVLVVDMPPGTGDAQLTMAQRVALSGAVIVSTPQDLALIDARKGLNMFRKTGVPVLGMIENMSTYVCPKCGHEEHLFGHGGAEATAKELECNFLGAIPLHLSIRELSDAGTPVTAVEPDGVHAAAYKAIAEKVWAKLQAGPNKEAPSLSFE